MATYSFIDVQASLTGPGGSINLGYGSANAEEGITVEMVEDKNQMTIGADGSAMHSLHAGKGGTITVRYLKTSPTNQLLSQMYDTQTLSSVLHGKNVITLRNTATGDVITGSLAAFKKLPNFSYAKDGGTQDWVFDVGSIISMLGSGNQ